MRINSLLITNLSIISVITRNKITHQFYAKKSHINIISDKQHVVSRTVIKTHPCSILSTGPPGPIIAGCPGPIGPVIG